MLLCETKENGKAEKGYEKTIPENRHGHSACGFSCQHSTTPAAVS